MRILLSICFLLQGWVALAQPRPNIIYIMSDDHDADAISAYNSRLIATPQLDRLAGEGVLFTRNFVANSICGPVRATVLTGQHSHKNGVKDNRTRFDSSKMTMPKLFQQAGYQTALVGKWHLHSYPTGFDFWNILPGQGLYFDPRFIRMQGDTVTDRGYATDVITDKALQWLDRRDTSRPFLLHVHHKAPHRNFLAPLQYVKKFHGIRFPEPPTLYTDTTGKGTAWSLQTMSILRDMKLCGDLKVDPDLIMDLPAYRPDSADIRTYRALFNRMPETERTGLQALYAERARVLREQQPTGKELLAWKYQWYMQDYLACVASVDENVGRLLDYLDRHGLTENTLVVYTGDQGMYLGENGWFDKRWMYDVSMQAPLLMRWPARFRPLQKINTLAQSIDYAPTLLDAAGIKVPVWMQGRSLLPLAQGKKAGWNRTALYYHFYEYKADHTVLPHLGIRDERYKLIYFYTVNEWELYDLKTDPQEQTNLISQPRYASRLKKMKARLVQLRNEYDDHEKAGELQ
jgi:arylsulfatase A-like enzyme